MNSIMFFLSAGSTLSFFVAFMLIVSSRRIIEGKPYLALAALVAALLFLKDFVERSGGSARLATFLIYVNFLYGVPALYLYTRSALGRAAARPLRHFLPAFLNLPCAVLAARHGIGSTGVDSAIALGSPFSVYAPLAYLNLLALGETVQVALYGGAIRRLLPRNNRNVRERGLRHIVMAVLLCYACYHAIRWTGAGIRLLGLREGLIAAKPQWITSVSAVLIAVVVGFIGLYLATTPELLVSARPAGAAPGGRRARCKYGGRPLGAAEAERLLERTSSYLSACSDLSEENVNPRRLAARLGVPYYLLSRVVNEFCGKTVGDLLREYRIERARELLDKQPEATILEVAIEAGFNAKSSFNEAFKKTLGMSPSEYRNRKRPGASQPRQPA